MNEMESAFTELSVLLDTVDRRVEKIDQAVRGNGEGLVTRVAVMERRITSLEEFVHELQRLRRWASMGVLALVGTLLWNMVEWYISTRP